MTDIVERLRRHGRVTEPRWGEPLLDEAADDIERLRAALKECSDELEEHIEDHYAQTKDHPAMKRRYDRDMAVVILARGLLP